MRPSEGDEVHACRFLLQLGTEKRRMQTERSSNVKTDDRGWQVLRSLQPGRWDVLCFKKALTVQLLLFCYSVAILLLFCCYCDCYWYTVILLYCYTVVLLYCYTVILLYCYTVILLYCSTVILLYCYTVILLYCYTVIVSYCYTVILL